MGTGPGHELVYQVERACSRIEVSEVVLSKLSYNQEQDEVIPPEVIGQLSELTPEWCYLCIPHNS